MDARNEQRMALSVAEAAEALGISRPSLYALLDRPGFPSFRVGRRVLISREGLASWVAEQAAMEAGGNG